MDTLSSLPFQLRRIVLALPSFGRLLLEPALLALALVLGSLLVYSLPLSAPVVIGHEAGLANAAPFAHNFHGVEIAHKYGVSFRWSRPQAALRFPNLPDGVYQLSLLQVAGDAASLQVHGSRLQLPARDPPRAISILIPSQQQAVELGISAPPIMADHDRRALGLALATGRLTRLAQRGPGAPWRPLAAAAALLSLVWLAARQLGAARREALAISLPLLAALPVAIVADPLRAGLTPRPLLLACLLLALALPVLQALLPPIAHRLGIELADPWRRWLILATTAVFVLALASRSFPGAMSGDIHFHHNRFQETLEGNPLLISTHRGVDFPYPPALYLLLMPLALLGDPETLLQVSAAVLTALGLPTIFFLVRRTLDSDRAALSAALFYGLFPASYLPVWWSFDTHIFAQTAALLTSVYLVWSWGRLHTRPVWLGLLCGLLFIFLGHFGFFLNVVLLLAALAAVVWLMLPAERKQAAALALALGVGLSAVWLVFYSAYTDLFLAHARSFLLGGMNEVNDRPPVPPLETLRAIFIKGLWAHYAAIPLVLAPIGLALLRQAPGRRRTLALVVGMTFGVSIFFGSLPLLTSSTISTRWLMFSSWPLAVCSGVAVDYFWRRGTLLRILGLAAMVFVGSWALRLSWLAMAYYVRPPEPF